jgi:hypothetical protein
MFRLQFSDKPEITILANSMSDVFSKVDTQNLISCEEFDPVTGEVFGGIYSDDDEEEVSDEIYLD